MSRLVLIDHPDQLVRGCAYDVRYWASEQTPYRRPFRLVGGFMEMLGGNVAKFATFIKCAASGVDVVREVPFKDAVIEWKWEHLPWGGDIEEYVEMLKTFRLLGDYLNDLSALKQEIRQRMDYRYNYLPDERVFPRKESYGGIQVGPHWIKHGYCGNN